MIRIGCALAFCLSLGAALGSGQQTAPPTANAPRIAGQTETPGSPGYAAPEQGSLSISPSPPAMTGTPPPSFPTTATATSQRIGDLMNGAAALVGQGNLSKAMELYNEVLTVAPRYAEAYRQRALALARLGDRVRAQMDYTRYLELDPRARDRSRDELQLFEQSGYIPVGEVERAVNDYGAPLLGYDPGPRYVGGWEVPGSRIYRVYRPAQQADMNYVMARDAFLAGHYGNAYRWAQLANRAIPQARVHALMAQILFAQRAYRGAASEARAAAALGPLIDWTTVYGYYDYGTGLFGRQFRALEEYVRQHPSSADARFLLGYQHLVLGQSDQGHAQLAVAAILEPSDVVAQSLLARDGVEIVRGQRGVAVSPPSGGRSIADVIRASEAAGQYVRQTASARTYRTEEVNQ